MADHFRLDGYSDVLQNAAERRATRHERLARQWIAGSVYWSDPIARAVVDKLAQDSLARGFTIEGDPSEDVLNEFTRLNAGPVFTDALCRARRDGTAAVLVLTEDAGTLEAPLLPNTLERITGLVAFSKAELQAGDTVYDDPKLLNYRSPVTYKLTIARAAPLVVHESRLLVFDNEPSEVAYGRRHRETEIGGMLGPVLPYLERYNESLRLATEIMRRKQQAVYKQSGLAEDMATPEGEVIVGKRIDLVDNARGLMNQVTIDAGDEYNVIDLALSGIDTTVATQRAALAAAGRYPQAVLFGEDIKGLGSLGEGEQGIYHGTVSGFQNGVVSTLR